MELKTGETLNLEGGAQAVIGDKLGEGGQGIVYRVSVNGKDYALKWYTCKFANKDKFRKNMENNINDGAPSGRFLWPLFLTEERDGTFGYVMDLRPKEYSEFSDILINKAEFPSMEVEIRAALNLVVEFQTLHRKGCTYQDLNDGNFFINIQNGDVLICDNDNVTPEGEPNPGNIAGKPGYMAPEVVTKKSCPNRHTDYHSLAVILFKLFVRHDPLMGEAYVKSVCITEKREAELYGSHPVFIFDPNDTSNSPVRGVHPNPINLWPEYPKFLRDAFIKTFCEGMKDPHKRLNEQEWRKILIRLRDNLLRCPCGKGELFLSTQPGGKPIRFAECGHEWAYPYRLVINSQNIPLFPGKKLYGCHTSGKAEDFLSPTGEVIANKKDPSLWGIRNLSQDNWSFTPPGREAQTAGNGGVIPVGNEVNITFNNISGKIEKI